MICYLFQLIYSLKHSMHTKSPLNFEILKLEALVDTDLRNVFVLWVILRLGS